MRIQALLSLVFLIWIAGTGFSSASEFRGQFNGIGTATGMSLTLQEAEGRIVGRFSPPRGGDYAINGRRTGEAAQGGLQRADRNAFFHLEMRPMGVQFLLIPSAPDGTPDLQGATDYSFVREGTVIPEPSVFEPAPARGVPVDIFQFIDSYRDWDPKEMTRIYAGMDTRYRELIQLFDHAAAELLWRICVTSPPGTHFSSESLALVLERQQTDCATYLEAVRAMRDAGFFPEFVRKANFQFELIRETVKCDRDMSPESKCADVGVMSAPMMMRWQQAINIMRSYVGEPDTRLPPVAQAPAPAPRPERVASGPESGDELADPEQSASAPQVLSPVAAGTPLPRVRPGSRSGTQEEVRAEPQEVSDAQEDGQAAPAVEADAAAQLYQGHLPRERPGVRLRR